MNNTKYCKKCKMEIDKKAKVCPHCRSKQSVGILVKVLLVLAVLMVFAGVSSLFSPSSSTTKTEEVKKVKMKEKITISDVDYTVEEKLIKKTVNSDDGGYLTYTADGKYLLVKVTINNRSKNPINISSMNFSLKDENNATYSAAILITTGKKTLDMFNFETINPNATESGYIVYDIANTKLKYTFIVNGENALFSNAGIEVEVN